MAIPELRELRNELKEKEKQNKVGRKSVFGDRDLTPYNALVRLPKKKNIVY